MATAIVFGREGEEVVVEEAGVGFVLVVVAAAHGGGLVAFVASVWHCGI